MWTEREQPDRIILEEVAGLMDIGEAFVEKDWFVTQTINLLVQRPYPAVDLIWCGTCTIWQN